VVTKRLPANDPRTIARDIPGLSDALFPQLVTGLVTRLNRRGVGLPECDPVPSELIAASNLQRAMLFEVAVATAEQLLISDTVDWETCLDIAVERQKKHFDAKLPSGLSTIDKNVSLQVARNLVSILRYLQAQSNGEELICSPMIPRYQWIASSIGDFALGSSLIEVKCTSKPFLSADYRQIIMYWLLSYSAALEGQSQEWSDGILVNPRLNLIVRFTFSELIDVIAAGRSKVELLEAFSAMVEIQVQ
jgi:hypothetical protein